MEIYQKIEFDAAHRLLGYEGNCNNIHGHRWLVEIWIEGETDAIGMVMDYRMIKSYIKDNFDHKLVLNIEDPFFNILNDYTSIKALKGNPTAENIAKYIKEGIKGSIKVRVYESHDNYAEA